MAAERDTPYQPLDSDSASSTRQGDGAGAARHKLSEPSSLDGSPTPLMQDGSGSIRTHFDVSSESGGGSDGEGGLKTGGGRGSKKTISFWVSLLENREAKLSCLLSFPDCCTVLWYSSAVLVLLDEV